MAHTNTQHAPVVGDRVEYTDAFLARMSGTLYEERQRIGTVVVTDAQFPEVVGVLWDHAHAPRVANVADITLLSD